MEITLKTVQVYDGMSEETVCFSASVYIDGKRVATASNRGYGGPNHYDWIVKDAEKQLADYAASLPPLESEYFQGELPINTDLLIDQLLSKHEENKKLKGWCKKETLYRLKGDKDGQWRVLDFTYSERVKKALHNKLGDKLEEICNERFVTTN